MVRRIQLRARWGRAVVAGVTCCALPLLAACEGGAEEPSDASPSAGASVGDVGERAAMSEAALKLHLAAFDSLVVFEGLAEPAGQRSPVDTALGFYGSETAVVEPAACTAFHEAAGLGTGADLTSAADDVINPVGPFFTDGVVPEADGGEAVAFAGVLTRAFHDSGLAASLPESLMAGDCARYDVRTAWDEGSTEEDVTIGEVDEVMLPDLDAPTVRVSYDGVADAYYDEAGEQQGEGARDPWTAYIHVHGPYAISVDVRGLEDEEAQVARVIAAFIDHVSAIG